MPGVPYFSRSQCTEGTFRAFRTSLNGREEKREKEKKLKRLARSRCYRRGRACTAPPSQWRLARDATVGSLTKICRYLHTRAFSLGLRSWRLPTGMRPRHLSHREREKRVLEVQGTNGAGGGSDRTCPCGKYQRITARFTQLFAPTGLAGDAIALRARPGRKGALESQDVVPRRHRGSGPMMASRAGCTWILALARIPPGWEDRPVRGQPAKRRRRTRVSENEGGSAPTPLAHGFAWYIAAAKHLHISFDSPAFLNSR
ncbi:hypothetical protein BDY21DRAFT_199203 [Lineolata rhizophorae]|uniref:Uncharacterized protein n=1 Tax=Lineolata rhizophorae TaxID=578093 RepID=A0A6A6P4V8_9PEZI|nr:hypothetical protein BDY21DRAFT_199203 [Lineolata rhizophorae]